MRAEVSHRPYRGMSGRHDPQPRTNEWLTPPWIVDSPGPFDLDPCASIGQPWRTAARHVTIEENGLNCEWGGRVWMNPPYGGDTAIWLKRLAAHGDGIALIFARTETEMFFESVWDKASAILFLKGRLNFHYPDGRRCPANSGAPSVLIAYGSHNTQTLVRSKIEGRIVVLK